jgi:phosphatidylglycerol:prolipoprotein diacylglycerol transferase
LILILLLATEKRWRPFAGRTFWLYMLVYAISRYVIELYRGDPRGEMFGFSTSQIIALVLAPLSIVMLAWLSRASPDAPETQRNRRRVAA